MDSLFKTFLDIKDIKFQTDDDFIDRLSRKYTSGLLLIFAAIVSMRQYFGDSIHCWCPDNCSGNHEKYANIMCWVSNTYYVSHDDNIPQKDEPKELLIVYYQWTPVILVLLAGMFVTPWALWKALNRRAGINVGLIIQAAGESQRARNHDDRQRSMTYAVHLLRRYLMAHRVDSVTGGYCAKTRRTVKQACVCCCGGRFSGNYLAATYLLIKVLYAANAIGQLFLLNVLLRQDYHLYGFYTIRYFLLGGEGAEFPEPHYFPKQTLCDFKVRQFGVNIHKHTIQCVLPINLFNEKVFALLWFWLMFVAIATILSMISWMLKFTFWPHQYYFVKRQLRAMEVGQRSAATLRKFAVTYLRRDGLFILRLICKNAGDLVAAEMLVSLWNVYSTSVATRRLASAEATAATTSCTEDGRAASVDKMTYNNNYDHPSIKHIAQDLAEV